MLRRSRALVVSALAAATLATALPVSAAEISSVAINPCRGDVGVVWEEWHQTILVTGVYAPAGAVDVALTCGVVRSGVTVGTVSETLPGPVGVVQGSIRTLRGAITICYEARVTYVDRTEYHGGCP